MVAKLVEDLVHLEGREDRLDEDGRLDRPARYSDVILRVAEDVVPEPRLEMALELRKIEVRPRTSLEQALGVSLEVHAEVEEPGRDVLAVDLDVALLKMPAARTDEEHGDLVVQQSSVFSPCSSEIVRSIASVRFCWPPTTFSHVGEFASSKSAM